MRVVGKAMMVTVMAAAAGGSASAQRAFTAGMAATVGDGWQMQGADVGLVLPFGIGPVRTFSVVGRLASFIDQGGFFANQRGIMGGLALAARSRGLRIAELGNEPDVTWVTLDFTFEVAGYMAANSPLDHGTRWTGAALLPSLRMGEVGGTQYSLTIGPTAFLGPTTEVRTFFGLRAEWPLAKPQRTP